MIDNLLRVKEVMKKTGLSSTSLYRYMQKGHFPKGVKLGPKAVAWPESKVAQWIEDRKAGVPLGQSQ